MHTIVVVAGSRFREELRPRVVRRTGCGEKTSPELSYDVNAEKRIEHIKWVPPIHKRGAAPFCFDYEHSGDFFSAHRFFGIVCRRAGRHRLPESFSCAEFGDDVGSLLLSVAPEDKKNRIDSVRLATQPVTGWGDGYGKHFSQTSGSVFTEFVSRVRVTSSGRVKNH